MAQQGYYQHNGNVSPPAGLSDDVAPPPPVHRVPVGNHHQRPSADPNDYSDYSTPGSDTASNEVPRPVYSQRSYASNTPLAPAAVAPAGMYSSQSSLSNYPLPQGVPYSDSPYNRYSSSAQNLAPQMGHINPNDVADDDDWGLGPDTPQNKRRSRTFTPFGASRDGSRNVSRNPSPGSSIAGGVTGAGLGAGAGAAAYAASSRDDGSGKYNAMPFVHTEKSDWMKEDYHTRKKNMWIAIAIIVVVLLGAILGGVLGSQFGKGIGGTSTPSNNANQPSSDDVDKDNKDDLSINSAEIKSLMNNKNLHKVFPGMDYTPLNAQYPDCLHVGPSQNNITRDLAVMSQLTNTVRLYGTDCNQTQMLIHAIDRLEIKDSMKIWLGVWLDSNDTTTTRQIEQTWSILDEYGCDYFKGIIIGNEVLYRKDLTVTQLLTHITDFRQNITDHKCKLPVAMADLGDNWTADMATKVDIVMSNIHPFFSGTSVEDAAAWTWNFWQNNDVALTAANSSIKQVIAEVGWPTGGGTNCGGATTCSPGSVAGIDELNQFMQDWICPALKNETEYFW